MEFEQALYSRYSVRSYTGEKPDKEALRAILHAGQGAPIACREFDHYIITVIEDPALLDEMEKVHNEEKNTPRAHPLFGAPVLILVSAKLPGTSIDSRYHYSAGCILENMTLQATALGLGSCLIGGVIRSMNKKPALVKKLGLPEGFVPLCSVIVGKTDLPFPVRDIPEDNMATEYIL